MSDFLSNLVGPALGTAPVLQPRLAARFEASPSVGFEEPPDDAERATPLQARSEPPAAPAVLSPPPTSVAVLRPEPHEERVPGDTDTGPASLPAAQNKVDHQPAIPPTKRREDLARGLEDAPPTLVPSRPLGTSQQRPVLPPSGPFQTSHSPAPSARVGNANFESGSRAAPVRAERVQSPPPEPVEVREEVVQAFLTPPVAPLLVPPALPKMPAGPSVRPATSPSAPPGPTVHVTIGRLEVRAAPPSTSTSATKPEKPRGVMSLEDYLKARGTP